MNIYDDAESPGFDPSDHPDLTPLIDCVMLLLVFFMITTAFYALRGLEVVMPPVSATAAAPEVDRAVNVYIGSSGAIQVRGSTVEPAQLAEVFKEAAGDGGRALVLEAAPQVEHERVVLVMDLARQAGIREVIFARMEEEGHGP